ncbi:MAG: hypothetical protein KA792_03580 [Bacteroidales bacterium]|nr:hypothetical protein [Bacteroidales bacterium]
MAAKRYSEDYILKFPLVHCDEARQKKYIFYKKATRIIAVLWVINFAAKIIISFFDDKFIVLKAFLKLIFYAGLIVYLILRFSMRKYRQNGTLITNSSAFAVNINENKQTFLLDKVNNLQVIINKETYHISIWKRFVLGIWWFFTNNEETMNFIEFDYENLHYRYELRLESESNVLLFERRIEEWKAKHPEIIKK